MRVVARGAGSAAAALLLTGCFWPAAGAGPGRTAHNPFEDTLTPETVEDLAVVWTAEVESRIGHIVTSSGAVHTSSHESITGYARSDGEQLWQRTEADITDEPQGSWGPGPMAVSDGMLWTAGGVPNLGGIYETTRLDPGTGEVLGPLPGDAGLIGGVRGEGYALYAPGFWGPGLISEFRAHVRDSDDPAGGWSSLIDQAFSGQPAGYFPLTLGEGYVYQTGWGRSAAPEGGTVRSAGVRAFPTAHVEMCSSGSSFACPEWFVPFETVSAPSVFSGETGTVYAVGSDGRVMALDADDGATLWSTTLDAGVTVEPAVTEGVLYVATEGSELVALDAVDGSALWTAPTSGAVRQQPAAAGGLVYTGSASGIVEAFDASGCGSGPCTPLWSDDTGSTITGAPAVDRGHLYVGTRDGRLIAYGLPG